MNVNQFKRKTSWRVLAFVEAFIFLLPSADATPHFLQFPPRELYVSNGKTARFVWNYHVDDRRQKFTSESPRWSFIDQNGSESIIGIDDKYTNNWDFVIKRETCPPRLLNPDRVSRELPATLVITNVTTADNGIYKCSLMLKAGNPKDDQVYLVVTVPPKFIPNHHGQTYQIAEGENLEITCIAIGPPTPNITWVNITGGGSIGQGSGSAILSINNIQRYHAGVYECQAENNPNEEAATRRTNIMVYYKPTILKKLSSKNENSWNGKKVTLKCIAIGLPKPNITWYNPNSQQITEDVRTIANSSQVTITTGEQNVDYGSYECQAKNIAGTAKLSILVTQLFPPGPPNANILEEDIQASSVIVRWNIPGYDGGSPVIDYKVQINSTKQRHEHNTSKFEHQFTDLRKNTRYEVKVYARNKLGYGNASITIFTTKKKATGENLNKKVEGQEKCSVTAVAVCVASLTVSLVFNILSLLYLWKMGRTENLKSKRNTKKEGNEDPVYDNALEMKASQTLGSSTADIAQAPVEYEPIKISPNHHLVEPTTSKDTKSTMLTGMSSHYQALTDPHEASLSPKDVSPAYEPLRCAQLRDPYSVANTTYQPLGIRERPLEYQSLQNYKTQQLKGNGNDHSII